MTPALRPPAAWDDVLELLREPVYQNLFKVDSLSCDSNPNKSFMRRVVAAIMSNKVHVNWVMTWMKIAFDQEIESSPRPVSSYSAIYLFIATAWHLYHKCPQKAWEVLTQAREDYGLLPASPSHGLTLDSEAPACSQMEGAQELAEQACPIETARWDGLAPATSLDCHIEDDEAESPLSSLPDRSKSPSPSRPNPEAIELTGSNSDREPGVRSRGIDHSKRRRPSTRHTITGTMKIPRGLGKSPRSKSGRCTFSKARSRDRPLRPRSTRGMSFTTGTQKRKHPSLISDGSTFRKTRKLRQSPAEPRRPQMPKTGRHTPGSLPAETVIRPRANTNEEPPFKRARIVPEGLNPSIPAVTNPSQTDVTITHTSPTPGPQLAKPSGPGAETTAPPSTAELQYPEPSCSPTPLPMDHAVDPPKPHPPSACPHSVASAGSLPSPSNLFISTSDEPILESALTLPLNLQLPPASHRPSLLSANASQSPALDNTQPPWLQNTPPPDPPSSARPPGDQDTHSWLGPQPDLRANEPLSTEPLSQPSTARKLIKPSLHVRPPVWAQSRQELCESLDYFRSYQGGVYSQSKRARGYLLDAHPSAHDLWHAAGKLIISHAGGNSAVNKQTKQTILITDQTVHSNSCAALLNSFHYNCPIVLIAGDGYNLFPYNLEGRSYVVLGYYWITHAWEQPERSPASPHGYFVRWKFAFQWIEAQGQPWWIPINDPKALPPSLHSNHMDSLPVSEPTGSICTTCQVLSPIIYKLGWVCTQSFCQSFFKLPGSEMQHPNGYASEFLTLKKEPPKFEDSQLRILPNPPVEVVKTVETDTNKTDKTTRTEEVTTSRHFWKGWHCTKCGRLSCREYWTHWKCSSCSAILNVDRPVIGANHPTLISGPEHAEIGQNAGVSLKLRDIRVNGSSYRHWSFRLPCDRGVIHLIRARVNSVADSIFEQYQRDAEDKDFFRRYCMKTHKLKGRMLSHYFSQNSGEPYQYVGGTNNTVPLDKFSSVKQAAVLIRKHASLVLGKDPSFNEVLSAAYMIDQKMEFHSDGEKDLGPVVASLSLGSSATMRFRPVPARLPHSEPPNEALKRALSNVITLTLRHGDVLVMEGAKIQEYYQHAIYPRGFRIAATARYIKPALFQG